MLWFGVLAFACLAVGGWLVVSFYGKGWSDLGKGLLSVGAAFAVGGAGAALLKDFEGRRDAAARGAEQRRQDQAAWADLLAQVVGIDHDVEVARQMIWAHRSVTTYRDQYAVLVNARLTLRRVAFDPLVVNDAATDELGRTIRDHLVVMRGFLEDFGAEYEERYLPVARQQRIDEVSLTDWCREAASAASSKEDAVYPPTAAWWQLMEFPLLGEFLKTSFFQDSDFIKSVVAVKPMLENRAGMIGRIERYDLQVLPTTEDPSSDRYGCRKEVGLDGDRRQEASRRLGVNDSRVRQLLRAGDLRGRHLGNSWLILAEDVARLQRNGRRPGRSLAPKRAWAALDLLDGGRATWLSDSARSQVRCYLADLVAPGPDDWRAALRGRSLVLDVVAHPAAIRRLRRVDGVRPVGPSAAVGRGFDLVALAEPRGSTGE